MRERWYSIVTALVQVTGMVLTPMQARGVPAPLVADPVAAAMSCPPPGQHDVAVSVRRWFLTEGIRTQFKPGSNTGGTPPGPFGPVATFSLLNTWDHDPSAWQAIVNWGDGTTSSTQGSSTQSDPIKIVADSDSPGTLDVVGTKTYAEEFSSFPGIDRTVTVVDRTDGVSGCGETIPLVPVNDAPLHVSTGGFDRPALAYMGQRYPVQIATFTDENPKASLEDFTPEGAKDAVAKVTFWGGSYGCTGHISETGSGSKMFTVSINPSVDCAPAHQDTFDFPRMVPCGVEVDDAGGAKDSGSCAVNVVGGVPNDTGQGPPNPCPPCHGKDAGDPVTLSSGRLTEGVTDLRIPGRGFDYAFQRSYQSGSQFLSRLGYNWDFNYNRRLIVLNSTNLADAQAQFPAAKVGDVERVDGGAGRADLYKANASGTVPAGHGPTRRRIPSRVSRR